MKIQWGYGWLGLLFLTQTALACDICGGFMINPRTGILTQVNRSFINLAYSQVQFDGENLSYNKDVFNTYLISGQYQISRRWGVGFMQSYSRNNRLEREGSNIIRNGWGNGVVQVFYAPLQRMKENSRLSWRTGCGLRLPWGSYDQHIHDLNVPENFNPSDGSWGLEWLNDLVFSKGKWGLLANSRMIIRGKDPRGGRLGHQVALQASGFRYFSIHPKWNLSPMMGSSVEFMGRNVFPSGREDENTGGVMAMAHIGTGLNTDQFSLNIQISHPIATHWNGDGVQPSTRGTLLLTYFIN